MNARVAAASRRERWSRIILRSAREICLARSRPLHRLDDDVPPRWTNSACASNHVVLPCCRARQQRSRSSAYMKLVSRRPSSSSHSRPSTSITAPIAWSTAREEPWSQCVVSAGFHGSGTKRLRPLARTSAVAGVVNGETVGWRLKSSLSSRGTTTPTRSDPVAAMRRATLPGAWTNASLLTSRYARPGSTRAPMLFAAANPTFVSTRTSTLDESSVEHGTSCPQWDRSRRRRPRPAGIPSSSNARTHRIV